jgi:hypothetical protein
MIAPSPTRLRWQRLLSVALVIGMFGFGAAAVGQEEGEDEAAMIVAQPAFADENFDQWVFQNQGNAQNGRRRIEQMLTLQTEEIDRSCGLSDAQKKKLQLAGRGDIKRFFDRVEDARKIFQAVKNDQNKFQEIWQHIQPLQTELSAGLFGESSIFRKTIRKTLTADQAARYEKIEHDRTAARYRAKIELAVAMLDNGLPLNDEQRRKLVALLVEQTKPPKRFGQYDYYVVMIQMAKLPEGNVKPLFDTVQWKALQQQLNNMRGMEQWLKQNGVFGDNAEDDAEPKPQPTEPKAE